MDFNEIRKLVRLVEGADISSLEIEEGELQIRIRKEARNIAMPVSQLVEPLQAQTAQPVVGAPATAVPAAPATEASEAAGEDPLEDVKSPMVGNFYRSPSPDAKPFVEVGDKVSAGQTLCIIEAMKIMNEIEAETTGTIAEILVDNASPVQFDQVLFRIDPR